LIKLQWFRGVSLNAFAKCIWVVFQIFIKFLSIFIFACIIIPQNQRKCTNALIANALIANAADLTRIIRLANAADITGEEEED
jgi:hypothetical protein